jgi:hypothetical protein
MTDTGTDLNRSYRTGPTDLKFALVPILPVDSHNSCSQLLSEDFHAFSARFYSDSLKILNILYKKIGKKKIGPQVAGLPVNRPVIGTAQADRNLEKRVYTL